MPTTKKTSNKGKPPQKSRAKTSTVKTSASVKKSNSKTPGKSISSKNTTSSKQKQKPKSGVTKSSGKPKTDNPKKTGQKSTSTKKTKTTNTGKKNPAKKKPASNKSPATGKTNSAIGKSSSGKPGANKKAKPVKAVNKRTSKTKSSVGNKASAGTPTSGKKKTGRDAGGSQKTKAPFSAYTGRLPYAFISYAHNDMSEVFNIIKKLKGARYRMWFDEGIEPGNEWPEVVGKAVLHSRQVIVFMSPSASRSRNVRNEINLAFSKNIDIIVVFLKKTRMSEGMRLQIGTVQAIQKEGLTQATFLDKLKKNINCAIKG